MKLIVGLGNPGAKYEFTRHNVGFRVVELARGAWQVAGDFSTWRENRRAKALLAEGNLHGEKLVLIKPQTFMNNSGEVVNALAAFYKIKPEDIWLIHDELDLPLGTIRITKEASAAGHKGVQSVFDSLRTQTITRLRIGIAPADPSSRPTDADRYVLEVLSKEEEGAFVEVLARALQALERALNDGLEKAASQFNS